MLKTRWRHVLIFATMLLCRCTAGPNPNDEEIKPVWPLPPEQPRIAYLGSYKGESTFYQQTSFETFLFGEREKSGFIDMQKPYGVAAYGDTIYVVDSQTRTVFILDTSEKKVSFLGVEEQIRLVVPIGIAIDADGNIYVSDVSLKQVLVYDSRGKLRMAIGNKDVFQNPTGLAIDNRLQKLYVVDTKAHAIHVYSTKGKPLFTFGKNGIENGEFHYPSNVAVDPRNGNIYVVDTMNFRVQVFNSEGKFIRKFGRIGLTFGCFSRPRGIAIDSEGHAYVVDANFGNFQIFDEQGNLLLFVGKGGYGPGEFYLPAGAYIDDQDRLYVVDSWNCRLQVFQYLSEKWKKEHPDEYDKYLTRQVPQENPKPQEKLPQENPKPQDKGL